jgi:hypothetical protein
VIARRYWVEAAELGPLPIFFALNRLAARGILLNKMQQGLPGIGDLIGVSLKIRARGRIVGGASSDFGVK